MKKVFILFILAINLLSSPVYAAESINVKVQNSAELVTMSDNPSSNVWEYIDNLIEGPETLFNAACCKVCIKGKACGNSCISRSYTCRKGPGCACDG
jgi:hypothetical protein